LLVVDDAHAEALLRLRGVERRSSLLDFGEELLPIRERVSKTIEHVFGFEIPERLELQPLGDVVLELLNLVLDQPKRTLEGIIRKPRKLLGVSPRMTQEHLPIPMKCRSSLILQRFASVTQSRTSNSGFDAVDKQHLNV
jgi:hypothetical protein